MVCAFVLCQVRRVFLFSFYFNGCQKARLNSSMTVLLKSFTKVLIPQTKLMENKRTDTEVKEKGRRLQQKTLINQTSDSERKWSCQIGLKLSLKVIQSNSVQLPQYSFQVRSFFYCCILVTLGLTDTSNQCDTDSQADTENFLHSLGWWE